VFGITYAAGGNTRPLCADAVQVREINKYTLQEDAVSEDVPRVGMYILQDERCWELLPPEEELDAWIAKLQLAVFGQEVIATEYITHEKNASGTAKVRDLKGAHFLTLQQQYGLMLATYKEKPLGAGGADGMTKASGREPTSNNVYIMSLEMDGAGIWILIERRGRFRSNPMTIRECAWPQEHAAVCSYLTTVSWR